MSQSIPAVLVFSGLDPSGGAGIQADIETLASHGCHTCPIVTSLTVQDTHDVKNRVPVDPGLLYEQASVLLSDIEVSAVKIGLLDDCDVVESIHRIITTHLELPVILDPVLASGGGTAFNDQEVQDAIRELLLPQTTILTPNSREARILAPEGDNLGACAMALLDHGCEFVFITGTHEPTEKVCNTLYGNHRKLEEFTWQRLEGEFHGSGCTLASSIAGLLAQGNEPMTAIYEAQEYTWQSLNNGYRIGQGQSIPNRFFWVEND
ncbi:MAG TPA: hydroxymethylpyrimidine/phosphomethylpyrimidine kinase [Gammaproteobacteria bacterium]|nr:hydroxymethylpyrimidine/phosphomethylpyrimidine kinase [Gammaproteobacteria bacterium]